MSDTGTTDQPSPPSPLRIAAHALLDSLPPEAMREMAERLTEIYRFWKDRPQ